MLVHTRAVRPALVPEVTLRLTGDVTALWEAMPAGTDRAVPDLPFWAAAWPGGQALARYVLDHPETVAGRTVLDLGSGSGLVALAAARAGATAVVASDVDPTCALVIALNAAANDVTGVQVVGDLLESEPATFEVILAGDVCYDRAMSARVLCFLHAARGRGVDVLLGDPGRAYLPSTDLDRLATYDVPEVDAPTSRGATVWRLH